MNAFLILGHGFEEPGDYDTREKLPADTYLVTMTECGVAATSADDMFPIIEGMIALPELFKDPETNQEHIIHLLRKGIRILRPGDPYPFLRTNLVINVGPYLAKSGIYKLPLTRTNFSIWPANIPVPDDMIQEAPYVVPLKPGSTSSMYLRPHPNLPILQALQSVYSGAIFPSADSVETTARSDRNFPALVGLGTLETAFTQTLPEIFTRLGPGVYYYPICRSIESPMKKETLSPFLYLEDLIQHSTTEDKTADLARLEEIKAQSEDSRSRLFTDKKLVLEALYPLAEKYKNTDPKNFPSAVKFANELQKTIERVNAVRARSTERQRTRRGGRKRKTRRMRRTIKTNRKYLN
jgi:hypothetical protein